ncbi:MAG: hypothetical protein DMF88_06740 [Acidobacteria bacterium]|nr:MAG: hypothetical protein DMF88_06740 [Acidobacteriota bacterium]
MAAGATIAAHGHFLFVNSGAPAALTALANQTYATGITDDGGVAITLPDLTVVDQVGLSAGSVFKEGAPLASLTSSVNQSYERKPGGAGGSGIDTNNNAADFRLISPSDPQNLASAIVPPLFTVSPAVSDFGSLALGSSAPSMLMITNTSTAPVTFTPFPIGGPNAGDFTVAVPATLAGGSFTSVEGTFMPSALGARNATLTINSVAGGSVTVVLAGTGRCPAVSLSSSLSGGTLNALYSDTLTASGGKAPYDFSTTEGTTPDGLSLASDGVLSGTPAAAGTFSFDVLATDATGCTGTARYSIAIARAPVTVSWSNPAPIVYGTLLGATQLNATTSTAGSFVYSPRAGTLLMAGLNQALSVAFTPNDTANYESGAAIASIDVTRA